VLRSYRIAPALEPARRSAVFASRLIADVIEERASSGVGKPCLSMKSASKPTNVREAVCLADQNLSLLTSRSPLQRSGAPLVRCR
jgi:hypothetical protein